MPIAPFLRRLRDLVGNELLVLPSVAVLPYDATGRILLVRDVDTRRWTTIGGAVEPDESPEEAAVREAAEEAGVGVALRGLRGVFGGPQFRITYPNGDVTSYVTALYDAEIVSGTPRPDGEETCETAWFGPHELGTEPLGEFTKALLRAARVEGLPCEAPGAAPGAASGTAPGP